jgi:vacuolar-type H+-ATPase subunit C/Vma6
MELALDQWHYQESRKYMESAPSAAEVLNEAMKLEADVSNMLTMLRFAQEPEERRRLQERMGFSDLALLLVEPGLLAPSILVRVGSQDNLDTAVELLAGTRYEPALREGLQAYKQTSRLSEFEIHLRRFRLGWLSKWIFKDPLGVGVFLGYLALKITEINNLRWITHGIQLGLGTGEIKAGLEYAS